MPLQGWLAEDVMVTATVSFSFTWHVQDSPGDQDLMQQKSGFEKEADVI